MFVFVGLRGEKENLKINMKNKDGEAIPNIVITFCRALSKKWTVKKMMEERKLVDGMRVKKHYSEQEQTYIWLKLEQTFKDKD